ncbi:hypothetical protein QFZ72_001074 [Bacillus sp. V2I10]|nr:hypothetical protein [Bacillus sp. V2I10]
MEIPGKKSGLHGIEKIHLYDSGVFFYGYESDWNLDVLG